MQGYKAERVHGSQDDSEDTHARAEVGLPQRYGRACEGPRRNVPIIHHCCLI